VSYYSQVEKALLTVAELYRESRTIAPITTFSNGGLYPSYIDMSLANVEHDLFPTTPQQVPCTHSLAILHAQALVGVPQVKISIHSISAALMFILSPYI
jgi:hypothetical protein